MAKKNTKITFPYNVYAVEDNDVDEHFISYRDSMEECVDGYNEEVEVAVYELKKVVKVVRTSKLEVKP